MAKGRRDPLARGMNRLASAVSAVAAQAAQQATEGASTGRGSASNIVVASNVGRPGSVTSRTRIVQDGEVVHDETVTTDTSRPADSR